MALKNLTHLQHHHKEEDIVLKFIGNTPSF